MLVNNTVVKRMAKKPDGQRKRPQDVSIPKRILRAPGPFVHDETP